MDGARTAEQFIESQDLKWTEQLAAGKYIKMKDIGREGWSYWVRRKWAFQVQHDFRVKVLVIERVEFDHFDGKRAFEWSGKRGSIEYRIGYYLLGGYRAGKGRWLWGQFSPMIPRQDFDALLATAKANGTLIDEGP